MYKSIGTVWGFLRYFRIFFTALHIQSTPLTWEHCMYVVHVLHLWVHGYRNNFIGSFTTSPPENRNYLHYICLSVRMYCTGWYQAYSHCSRDVFLFFLGGGGTCNPHPSFYLWKFFQAHVFLAHLIAKVELLSDLEGWGLESLNGTNNHKLSLKNFLERGYLKPFWHTFVPLHWLCWKCHCRNNQILPVFFCSKVEL